MDEKETLREAGLSEREAKTYLALLELGTATAGPIIKKSDVPNSKIYEILDSLQNKGLVSWIKKKKIKHFQASNPEKIILLFEEKKREITENLEKIKAVQKKSENQNSTEMFEGLNALKNAYLEFLSGLNPGDVVPGFSTGFSINNSTAKEFYDWTGRVKNNKKVISFLLISEKNKKDFKNIYPKHNTKNWKTRFSKVSFPGDVAVIPGRIILLNWEDPPTALIIKSKNLAKEYSDFFMNAWKNAEQS